MAFMAASLTSAIERLVSFLTMAMPVLRSTKVSTQWCLSAPMTVSPPSAQFAVALRPLGDVHLCAVYQA